MIETIEIVLGVFGGMILLPVGAWYFVTWVLYSNDV